MANKERNSYKNESVQDRIRKYTRPHPIVTSHLRNLQHSYQTAGPAWVQPVVYPGILTSPSFSLMTPHLTQLQPQPQPLMAHSVAYSTVPMNRPLGQQSPIQNNRKRRHGSEVAHSDNPAIKKKKDQIPPSLQSAKPTAKFSKLASEILSFTEKNTQSDELLQKKLHLRSALLSIFRRQFPGASLHLVGSSCNGFAGADSDADFCVMLTQNGSIDQKYEACNILRQLQKSLRLLSCIKKIILIRAKVPILKFTDTISGCECDVNINNSIGIRNTHLLRSYGKYDNRLIPLVVIIKHWAKSRNINDASAAGCNPPVLISLQKEHPSHFNMQRGVDELPLYEPVEFINHTGSQNKKCVGELLRDFFDYYANVFQYDFHAASVRLGRAVSKSTNNDWSNKFICVEEPFDLSNTARAVYDFGKFCKIKQEFKSAHSKISKDPSIFSLIS